MSENLILSSKYKSKIVLKCETISRSGQSLLTMIEVLRTQFSQNLARVITTGLEVKTISLARNTKAEAMKIEKTSQQFRGRIS